MQSKRKDIYIFLILGLLLLIGMLFFGFRFGAQRVRAKNPPPMILIHKPLNLDEIPTDQGTFLHATARSDQGVARIELWVDGEFIFAQDAPDSGPVSPLVLHTHWQPPGIGIHEVVVRAFDAKDQSGTASLLILGLEPADEVVEVFDPTGILESGEIPEEGTPTEPQPEPSAGSEDDSADYTPAGPGGSPPPDEPAPPPLSEPFEPGIREVFDIFPVGEDTEPSTGEGPTLLKLEALGLDTGSGYEDVHCYIGFGDRTPRWYPDSDSDQSTDENFSEIGEGLWNVAEYLSEENGIITYWPESDPIHLEINCIGLAGGGTEAVDLGHLALEIPSSNWDGVTRQASASAEGSFTIDYRVTYEEAVPKGLNPDMPVPFNVHIDDRLQELHWDWEPSEEYPFTANGFLIFVNDVLVYRVSYRDRAVWLPSAWFNPPCDVDYRFTVRAYMIPYPDGDYSEPSNAVILPDPSGRPRTDCNPEFVITFDTLVTGDLGGDDLPNNWANMVQPVYGSFFANDQSTDFFAVTLLPDQTYNINELTTTTAGVRSQVVYEIAEGEYFRIGFDLVDYDGRRSQLLCTNSLFHDYTYSRLMEYGYFEDTLYSLEDDGHRCQVHYTIRPNEGTVIGTGNPNFMPLPWIDVTGISEDPDSGLVQIQVKNNGNAEWAGHNLRLGLRRRGSEPGSFRYSYNADIRLEVGEEITLNSDVSLPFLEDYCVYVDPDNVVLELYENTGAVYHEFSPYCLPLPDLRIEDVQYDPEFSKLLVKVRNMGDSNNGVGTSGIDIYDLDLRVDPVAAGPNFSGPNQRGHEVIERTEAAWIEWTLSGAQRELMLDGYTVIVDPDDDFLEKDETNNTYSLDGGTNLRIVWDGMRLRWYPNWLQDCSNDGAWAANDVNVWVEVYARSEYSDRRMANWHWGGEIAGTYLYSRSSRWATRPLDVVDFFIEPEESLAIDIRGRQDSHSMGSATALFEPGMNWESMMTITPAGSCDESSISDMGIDIMAWPSGRWSYCGGWSVFVNICDYR